METTSPVVGRSMCIQSVLIHGTVLIRNTSKITNSNLKTRLQFGIYTQQLNSRALQFVNHDK